MFWICEVCQRPNNFAEGAACSYNNGKEACQGNLEMMENFDMKDTINKLNVKAGFKTSEIKLFKTKTIHLTLNNLNKHNDNTAMLNFSGNIIL